MEDEFQALINESRSSGWEFVGRENEVTISKKPMEASPISCFRGQTILEFSPDVVARVVCDNSLQTSFNPQLQKSEVIEEMEEASASRVLHKVFRAKKCMLEIHRDVLFLEKRKLIDGTFVVLATSKGVDQSRVASPQNCTRAEVFISGWVLEPWIAKGGKIHTNACYLIQCDLKGLPTAILELSGKEQPLVLSRLQQELAKGVVGARIVFGE